ncbi:phage tail protein [Paenibacillus peoriae]|uniref:phage tail-collar fiber domain-containing protein n=1 Tax=Paenibacillus TaxID=44249 RepID=UPI001F135B56|nr:MULTISPECIES: phage tail protein [Paenibacillus]MCP3808486.1 phage tail protein [Paenibacillus sp. Lou8.1]UMY53118.1 phage tail protein [Paenibacillus peoriae]
MAEQVLTVTTVYAREQMAQARAEGGTLTKVVKMAFGSGGVDTEGKPLPLDGTEQVLKAELIQKDISGHEFIAPATIRYVCSLAETELAGKTINELALVDSAGKFTAVRTMTNKIKDGDIEFVFEIDDIY